MIGSIVHSRQGTWLVAAAIAAAIGGAAPAFAQAVPPGYDGSKTTYNISPGSILRNTDSFFSLPVATMGRNATVPGAGKCTDTVCPVTYGGKSVFARRSRLSLNEKDAAAAGVALPKAPAAAKPASGATASGAQIAHKLQQGDQGDDVKRLQEALNKSGASLTADGNYGSGTVAAVEKFQQAKGLDADGVAGAKTLRALGL